MNALSTRLQQARGRLFVGRASYLESFARALGGDSWPVAVWHLHGVGGVGKTSLLRQWKTQAQNAGVVVITLDGRDFDPTSAAFCAALGEALVEHSGEAAPSSQKSVAPKSLCAAMASVPSRLVLQIDTYELLAPLDRFLRESFLPHLPENATVMFAGREALSFEWRSDAAWRELVRELDLDGLSVPEGQLYLEKRGIEANSQVQLLKWAHGHPLALSLAADVWLQRQNAKNPVSETTLETASEAANSSELFSQNETLESATSKSDSEVAPHFASGELPQLVGPLLGHLVREVPTPAHRAALEASAIVTAMTQELLGEMLGDLVRPTAQAARLESSEESVSEFPGEPSDNSPSDDLSLAANSTKNEGNLASAESATPDVYVLFEWLRGLSIMQSQRFGVFPHDLARELLVADLHWRSPDWHVELHRRAREHYLRRIQRARGAEQQRAIFNCIYLHRLSPVVAPYLRWSDASCSLGSARPGDVPVLLEMVEKHEGKISRDLAARHFEAEPDGIVVVRNENAEAQGFVFQLALHNASDEICEIDPGTRRARDFLRANAPLRVASNSASNSGSKTKIVAGGGNGGDRATLFRFWMDKDAYQGVSATQSLIFVQAVRHYMTTPHLAFTFFPCADPDFWSDGFAYADLERLPDADFNIEERKIGVFGHDWRARPVLSWLDLLLQREMQSVTLVSQAPPPLPRGNDFVVLDEEQFLGAVQLALRPRDAGALRRNPLLQTALVHHRALRIAAASSAISGNAPTDAPSLDQRVFALRDLLKEAIAEVERTPRQDKSHRALELVFGRRALSQEAAAAAMNVSHSSLRRYLRAGVAQVVAALHERENQSDMADSPGDSPFNASS